MIDAHHHLWRYDPESYGWIGGTMEVLKRDYLPDELLAEAANAGVDGTIAVQARQTVEETRWLLELAESNPLICGVVGWFDLRSEELGSQLQEFSSSGKLVGVRHVLQDEAPGFMLDPAFLRGIGQLQSAGLAYDLLVYPHQMEEAVRLVDMFPDQVFVLDHMAKPPVRSGVTDQWLAQMEALAGHPGVWCKISGLVTEADPGGWSYEGLVPFLEAAKALFGTDRIMVGSDWPVCRLAAEYGEVMEIPRRFFADVGSGEQSRVFVKNALVCYGLDY